MTLTRILFGVVIGLFLGLWITLLNPMATLIASVAVGFVVLWRTAAETWGR